MNWSNNDPFTPWNDPMDRTDPFKPWNDPRHKDDPFAPWNTPLANEKDYEKYKREHHIDD
jgi:hypothetical protein